MGFLDGEYPNGIFTGQMTFDKTGADPQKGSQVLPANHLVRS